VTQNINICKSECNLKSETELREELNEQFSESETVFLINYIT